MCIYTVGLSQLISELGLHISRMAFTVIKSDIKKLNIQKGGIES